MKKSHDFSNSLSISGSPSFMFHHVSSYFSSMFLPHVPPRTDHKCTKIHKLSNAGDKLLALIACSRSKIKSCASSIPTDSLAFNMKHTEGILKAIDAEDN